MATSAPANEPAQVDPGRPTTGEEVVPSLAKPAVPRLAKPWSHAAGQTHGAFKGSPQHLGELARVGQARREGNGMHPRLSPALEKEIRRLIGRGHGKRAVARMVGVSKHAVLNVLARGPHPKLTAWNPSPARLSLREREEIRVGLEQGETFTAIAQSIGRAVSTVSREVGINGGRGGY